jgi:ParB/RepB/Spo0J family partition protein
MDKKPKQASLLDASIAAQDAQSQMILRRLHIEAVPDHETRLLPIAHIQVSDEAQVRVPKSLVQSIQRFGVLQAPSVVCCGPCAEEDNAVYEVIAGRRRVIGARLAGLPVLKCEVYTSTTPQLSALLALIENTQRSAAWVKEVADLHKLIDERVGMTVEELVACGFSRQGLAERLKIAQLPKPLLDQIMQGRVPLDVARKLVRLTSDQLTRVIQATEEEPLTADRVQQALQAQISEGISAMQGVFPTWEVAATAASREVKETEGLQDCELSVTDLLATLRTFTQSRSYKSVEDAHILIEALIQRLEVAIRETSALAS